jgi:hypothetical protein
MPAAPPSDDPLLLLPGSLYYQVVHELRSSLPAAADDSPEAETHRIHAAIADVASMLPANAEEATIAVRCVAAHAQAIDCLRLARLCPDDAAHVMRCSAQSAAMMRTANGTRSLLLRVQAARAKREATPEACDKAAWVEHCAAGLMLGALREATPASPPPAPAADPAQAPPDRFAALTEAEQYATLYPQRAALIRARGGMPDDGRSVPPVEPGLVAAIVASTSPILRALDHPPPDRAVA